MFEYSQGHYKNFYEINVLKLTYLISYSTSPLLTTKIFNTTPTKENSVNKNSGNIKIFNTTPIKVNPTLYVIYIYCRFNTYLLRT